jgi:hypothetical protein
VPTLYYSAIAALISILASFGVGSVSLRPEGERMEFYNLVRAEDGFRIYERNSYIRDVFRSNVRSWHLQILEMYERFPELGIALPRVEMRRVRELYDARAQFDYDLLGQTTMEGAFGERQFFDHLPHVMATLGPSINLLKYLKGGALHNKCDKRFESLSQGAEKLANGFGFSLK